MNGDWLTSFHGSSPDGFVHISPWKTHLKMATIIHHDNNHNNNNYDNDDNDGGRTGTPADGVVAPVSYSSSYFKSLIHHPFPSWFLSLSLSLFSISFRNIWSVFQIIICWWNPRSACHGLTNCSSASNKNADERKWNKRWRWRPLVYLAPPSLPPSPTVLHPRPEWLVTDRPIQERRPEQPLSLCCLF